MIAFLLVVLGLVLIFLEFYLPGAIMGILGTLALVSGIILFASQTDSLLAIGGFVFAVCVMVAILIRFAVWRLRHATQGTFYLDQDQEGYQACEVDLSVCGKEGIVLADLKPGGYILVQGKRYAAISVGGYIAKGERIKVIGGQEYNLVVTPINQETNA